MAIDSRQKRMSAINPGVIFRGPMVDATESGFTQGNRQAAAFHYSGIDAGEISSVNDAFFLLGRRFRGVGRGVHRGQV